MVLKKRFQQFCVGSSLIFLLACANAQPSTHEVGLRVNLIEQAMDAVDATLGSGQEYFEINASDSLVNLFLATDLDGLPNPDGLADATMHYVFTSQDGLDAAPLPLAANGPTFTRVAVRFSAEKVLLKVMRELPDSTSRLFVISAGGTASTPTGIVEYRVQLNSSQGGEMSVLVTKDGDIIGTDAS